MRRRPQRGAARLCVASGAAAEPIFPVGLWLCAAQGCREHRGRWEEEAAAELTAVAAGPWLLCPVCCTGCCQRWVLRGGSDGVKEQSGAGKSEWGHGAAMRLRAAGRFGLAGPESQHPWVLGSPCAAGAPWGCRTGAQLAGSCSASSRNESEVQGGTSSASWCSVPPCSPCCSLWEQRGAAEPRCVQQRPELRRAGGSRAGCWLKIALSSELQKLFR